jgi:uncharacterized membrane protein YraQ (UPF0718 family)
MSYIGHQLFHALSMAFAMFWEIFWALALGFFISGIVQAVERHRSAWIGHHARNSSAGSKS